MALYILLVKRRPAKQTAKFGFKLNFRPNRDGLALLNSFAKMCSSSLDCTHHKILLDKRNKNCM